MPYLTKCPHQGHKCFEGFLGLHFNHIYILFTNIVLWGVLEVPTKRFFVKSVSVILSTTNIAGKMPRKFKRILGMKRRLAQARGMREKRVKGWFYVC